MSKSSRICPVYTGLSRIFPFKIQYLSHFRQFFLKWQTKSSIFPFFQKVSHICPVFPILGMQYIENGLSEKSALTNFPLWLHYITVLYSTLQYSTCGPPSVFNCWISVNTSTWLWEATNYSLSPPSVKPSHHLVCPPGSLTALERLLSRMKSDVVPQTRAFSKCYRTKFAKSALEIRTVTLFVHI